MSTNYNITYIDNNNQQRVINIPKTFYYFTNTFAEYDFSVVSKINIKSVSIAGENKPVKYYYNNGYNTINTKIVVNVNRNIINSRVVGGYPDYVIWEFGIIKNYGDIWSINNKDWIKTTVLKFVSQTVSDFSVDLNIDMTPSDSTILIGCKYEIISAYDFNHSGFPFNEYVSEPFADTVASYPWMIPPLIDTPTIDASLVVASIVTKVFIPNKSSIHLRKGTNVETEIYTPLLNYYYEKESNLTYNISKNYDDHFIINQTTGVVKIKNSLNNIVDSLISITIQLEDKVTKYTETQNITFNIINDGPVITLPFGSVIYSDTPSGTLVYEPNVSNTDGNILVFEFVVDTTNYYANFVIDSRNGEVKLLTSVTPIQPGTFTIKVTDTVTNLYNTHNIGITILERHAPIIIYPLSITIHSDITSGTLVYQPNVSNQEGNILEFQFVEDDNDYYANFSIDSINGEVKIFPPVPPIDPIQSGSFTIKVTDTVTRLYNTHTIPVTILERLAPKIILPFNFTIYSDTPLGTLVYEPNVSNQEGNILEFQFIDDDNGFYANFGINSINGEVKLFSKLLGIQTGSFTIKVTDTVTNLFNTHVITVRKIERVAPVFLSLNSLTIYDDTQPGTIVYSPNVSNPEGNILAFEIIGNMNDDYNYFSINSTSGEVSLLTPVTHTIKSSYLFTMRVTDTITKLYVNQTIIITNNERLGPKFYSPTIQLNTYEDAPDFTLVYGARVKTQKGSLLQFSFDISGNTATRNLNINDSSNFIIDSTTGEVRIIKSQSVTSTTAYNFKISVKDTITNLGDTQSLTITNNYGTPYFLDGPSISITVYDDHDLTEKIYTPSLNYTSDLGYTLVSGLFDNDFFTFNNNISGNVFLTKEPYAEGINEYTFQIKATNSINNKYATQQVLVNIKKRPLPPYFTDISYNIQLDDTIQAEKLIYNFIAVSAYENKIKYYIIDDGIAVNGDDTQFFNIDINNGSLTFTDLPDKLDYKIKIKVVDIINLESLTSSTIEIHLNNIVYFEEGDNKIIVINEKNLENLENSIIYRPIIKYNSKFINTSNINLNINGEDKDKFTINANSVIHADNVYFSINNTTKISPYNFELVASIPDINLTLKQSVRVIVNFTSCTQTPPDPPNLWSRATLSCVDYDVYSQEEFAMRQKAEVLKYKGNKNPLTKKQQFSRNVNGNGPLGKKVWATQNILGSNPNVFNLPQVGNTLILCPNDDTEDKYFAYVADFFGNKIYGYAINSSSGELTLIGNFTTGIGPSSVMVDPTGKFLYVANSNDNNLYGYNINQSTGILTNIGTFPSGNFPKSITITGKFVYVTNNGTNTISGYEITSTGALSSIGTFITGNFPISIMADPTGKFAYVTTNVLIGLFGYDISSTGALSNIVGSPVGTGFNPTSIAITGKFVYVINNGSNTISGYEITSTGALSSIGTFITGNAPISITVDPTGKFVYVINSDFFTSNGYVYGYSITSTGLLNLISGFPFLVGSFLDSITVDPTGKFVYITNLNPFSGGYVSAYMINSANGFINSISGSPFLGGISANSIITTRILGNKKNNVKCEPSSSSDVPGNSILCYDPAVPLVNYLPPPRTYLAGGTKWPQYTWKPGDNGFPRGKKGMGMLFQ
jgi:6-phosphogluconolactonase (cycloisomerase 2 family)